MCEEYRQELMAFADGELSDNKRAEVEAHLIICSDCSEEFHRFKTLGFVCHSVLPKVPGTYSWKNYYGGVFRKMESRVSLYTWSAAAFLILAIGAFLTFNNSSNSLTAVLGVISMTIGCAFIWLSYFCNSCKNTLRDKSDQNDDEIEELFR